MAPHMFQNGAWSQPLPHIAVFDDAFVAQNVCSGIEIETAHRQNLHELILGGQGVQLNATVLQHIAAIEQHNRTLKERTDAIPAAMRGALTADAFCALQADARVDGKIEEAERQLAAARAADAVQRQEAFQLVRACRHSTRLRSTACSRGICPLWKPLPPPRFRRISACSAKAAKLGSTRG